MIRNYRDRMVEAIAKVESPYVTMCADDDLINTDCALGCTEFLDRNAGYIACHGIYVGFSQTDTGIDVNAIVYGRASIDGAEIATRLMQLYSGYEATFYAVYRTGIQRSILESIPPDLERFLMVEACQSAASVLRGKIKRLDGIYYFRNNGVAPHPRDVEGWNQWMAQDFGGFYSSYLRHRARIVQLADSISTGPRDLGQLGRAIDMSFLLHVGREFHPGYWIEEYLSAFVRDPGDRNRLRDRLDMEMPHAQPAGLTGSARRSIRRLIRSAAGDRGMDALRRMRAGLAGGRRLTPAGTERYPGVRVASAVWERFSGDEWAAIGPRLAGLVGEVPSGRVGKATGAGSS